MPIYRTAALCNRALMLSKQAPFDRVSLRLLEDYAARAAPEKHRSVLAFQSNAADKLEPSTKYWAEPEKVGTVIGPTQPGGQEVLYISPEEHARAVKSSWVLRRRLSQDVIRRQAQLMWLTSEDDLHVPLVPLARLLAAALARERGETTIIVRTRSGRATFETISGDGTLEPPAGTSEGSISEASLSQLMPALTGSGEVTGRVVGGSVTAAAQDDPIPEFAPLGEAFHAIIINEEAVRRPPAKLPFDRVLIACTALPRETPPAAREALHAGVWDEELDAPSFSSVVPVILGAPSSAGAFRTTVVPDNAAAIDSLTPAERRALPGRLGRDAVRIPMSVDRLHQLAADPPSVPVRRFDELDAKQDPIAKALRSFARAVTNTRVGLALSGGGAAVYGLVPLLHWLADPNGLEEGSGTVPLDFVSAISGGSILASFLCALGLERGMRDYVACGPVLNRNLLLAMMSRTTLPKALGADVGGAMIDGLQPSLLIATTAFPKSRSPQQRVVTGGTIGEAVRASSALPPLFPSPKHDGIAFMDGAGSQPLPLMPLVQAGADIVFAANALRGTNARVPRGGFFRRAMANTPVGRLVDAWLFTVEMIDRQSCEVARQAKACAETGRAVNPGMDAVRFGQSAEIAKAARSDPALQAGALAIKDAWAEFAGIKRP